MDSRNTAPHGGQGRGSALGFEGVLLPSGWARDVVITIDDSGLIEAVETGVAPASRPEAEWSAAPAIPGMANVHSHAHQRLMTGLAERSGPDARQHDTFWTWREVMFSFVERITPEQLHAVAEQAYIEMLEAGFTAVGEFQYLHNQPDTTPYDDPAELSLRCLAAAESTGIAVTLLPVLYSRGGFDGRALQGGQRRFHTTAESILDIVARLDRVIERSARQGLQRIGLAPHSLRAVGLEELELAATAFRATHPDAPIHMHIAEQTVEVDDCLEHSGMRPAEWLLRTLATSKVPVDASWCLIHATHLKDSERRALAESGAIVGLCPTTEANLGDGTFPARAFLKEGGRLAIGTDSQIRISVAEDLRQLEASQRLRDRERNVLASGPETSTGRTLYDHACAGGAAALNQPMGSLAVGRRADIVVLDPDHDRLLARTGDELLDSWIFAGDNACVKDVIVGGRLVVKDGRHIDRNRVLQAFRETLKQLDWKR